MYHYKHIHGESDINNITEYHIRGKSWIEGGVGFEETHYHIRGMSHILIAPQVPQFMTNPYHNKSPFKMNQDYDITKAGEANTYNNIWAECCFLYGNDCIYIQREVMTAEDVFGEFLGSYLSKGYPVRLFCDDLGNGAWSGSGDMYAKFGLQIQDEATWYCPTLMFNQMIATTNPNNGEVTFSPVYPKQGDLIYYVNGKKLFDIIHIEPEALPGMYVFGNKNSYVFKTKLYTYDHQAVADDPSIPKEIQALDRPETIKGITYDIAQQELDNFNIPAQKEAAKVVNTKEVDPLTQ